MATTQYLGLLRGINVGGKNPVPMADLRATIEAGGYGAVRTYIQSGNVMFEADGPAKEVEDHLEEIIEARFGIPLVVVVRSLRQLRDVVRKAPDGFAQQPDTYHSDVLFLKAPLTPKRVLEIAQLRDGVDAIWPGTGVVYFQRLSERRVQSKLSKIVGTPEYQLMTIRSWSTTTKLLDLMEGAS
jgi:uncharacterized protein (DUF1697 family)